MKLALTRFSLRFPWLVIGLTLMATIFLASQFPKVHFDNDPENMLDADEPVRLFHDEVKTKYDLYDFVIVGIVNESHPDGIFNVDTLGRIDTLTQQLLSLHRTPEGLPAVDTPAAAGAPRSTETLDLSPSSAWQRGLNVAFRHDPNRLFTEDDQSAIIAREIISPSVVDNIKQADLGSLRIEYLMENPPATREEALAIRDDAMNNPLYYGTLVSENGKALCLYLPVRAKHFSHNVANLVTTLTTDWPAEDRILITGLPVAEDTFGVEMLVQMATSAPLAGLAIFLLLLLFFRRISLIIAPMLVAVLSIICTMGLLIGGGHDVHIMSSMIAIFLMPIAVADSVHILSEFYDSYPKFRDKAKTVSHVVGHLFSPMLYTSLTTVAGFASLATTPIPPVRIFGLHVAFGVALAWLLTMTFVPAFIMVAVPTRSLDRLRDLSDKSSDAPPTPRLNRALEAMGRFSCLRWKLILALTAGIVVLSAIGIPRIHVNDNPIKWFIPKHPMRIADDVLNSHFGGTYTAYLTLRAPRPQAFTCHEKAASIAAAAEHQFSEAYPEATRQFLERVEALKRKLCVLDTCDPAACFSELSAFAAELDHRTVGGWNALADAINYLDTNGLTLKTLESDLRKAAPAQAAHIDQLLKVLAFDPQSSGEPLLAAALAEAESRAGDGFVAMVSTLEAELTAPLFKQPAVLRDLDRIQSFLASLPMVGKSTSALDALKKASYELQYLEPPAGIAEAERAAYDSRNTANFSPPSSAAAAGQVYAQLEGMKKRDALFHLVTRNYEEANIWVQLRSGDNQDMESVIAAVETYLDENPTSTPLLADWAGLTYINVIWQRKMVVGMLGALASSAVVVFVMMLVLFRSPLYGVLSMIPLSVTIAFIYGVIGLVGKDYDMPVAVLSSLTLGLSVDFAIHFLERAREYQRQLGSWRLASAQMFKEPALAISRNAVTISVGFTPLLLAPLVPYRTVGFFLATIMAVSWLGTLFILPALLTGLQRFAFKPPKENAS